MTQLLPSLAQRMITWQRQFGRHDLPWQNTQDPYRVWLSEIMLQQTQVITVMGYFNRFIDRFPNVKALADASIEDVLVYWAGLGYYARARNLHACAQHVVALWGGKFPPNAESLQTLPGIGPSTAAAIAAFCFAERTPILDGNVKRVYCRFFGVEGDPSSRQVVQQLWQHAIEATPSQALTLEQPDAMPRFTQGLMDLGATCCTRRQPSCDRCPLASDCVAKLTGRTSELPHPRARRTMPERSTIMLLIMQHMPDLANSAADTDTLKADMLMTDKRPRTENVCKAILLHKRPSKGIWGGLWSLPECQTESDINTTTHQLSSEQLAPEQLALDQLAPEQLLSEQLSPKQLPTDQLLTAPLSPNMPKQKTTQTLTSVPVSESIIKQWCMKRGVNKPKLSSMATFRHTFTHFHLHIQPWLVEIDEASNFDLRATNETMQWVRVDQLHRFGMPAPVQNLVLSFAVLRDTH